MYTCITIYRVFTRDMHRKPLNVHMHNYNTVNNYAYVHLVVFFIYSLCVPYIVYYTLYGRCEPLEIEETNKAYIL